MKNINKIPTSEERRRMIETAAYYRAQKRGFSENDSVKDWLESEREIDATFQQADDVGSGKQEHAAYQRMRAEFKQILAGAQDTINAETVCQLLRQIARRRLGLISLVRLFPGDSLRVACVDSKSLTI